MNYRIAIVPLLIAGGLCLPLLAGCSSDDTPAFFSEGSAAEPVELEAAPVTYSGTVRAGGESYYRIQTDMDLWQVSMSNIDGEADLYVYDDAGFSDETFAQESCPEQKPGAEAEACEVDCPATSCEFFIRIQGGDTRGASYNLSVVAIKPASG